METELIGSHQILTKCNECNRFTIKTKCNCIKKKSATKRYNKKNKKYRDDYNETHKFQRLVIQKRYYETHKEEINKKQKEKREENKEEINKRMRDLYHENLEHNRIMVNLRAKRFYKKHKDEINKKRRKLK